VVLLIVFAALRRLVPCFALAIGCVPLSAETLEPALRAAVLDPAVLARICETTPDDVGPPSASALVLSEIRNERSADGSGSGSAAVSYAPVGGDLVGTTCSATLRFDFEDGGGERVTAGSIRIQQLEVVGRG
jgi:hypothetical protein